MEKIKLKDGTIYSIFEISENIIENKLQIVMPLDSTVEEYETVFSQDNTSSIKLLTATEEFMNSFTEYTVLASMAKGIYTYSQAEDLGEGEADGIVVKEIAALTISLEKKNLQRQVEELQNELKTINEIVNQLLITTLKE